MRALAVVHLLREACETSLGMALSVAVTLWACVGALLSNSNAKRGFAFKEASPPGEARARRLGGKALLHEGPAVGNCFGA